MTAKREAGIHRALKNAVKGTVHYGRSLNHRLVVRFIDSRDWSPKALRCPWEKDVKRNRPRRGLQKDYRNFGITR